MIVKYMAVLSCIISIGIIASGCAGSIAGIEPPSPNEVIKDSLEAGSLQVGMTKQEVESLWGTPNEIKTVEDKEKWKGSREVWIYRAQYGAVPVDAGYLSKNKKLYFDGNNLTTIE